MPDSVRDGAHDPNDVLVTAVTAALHLLAAVLLISGAQKLLAPGPAAEAMRAAGLPSVGPDAVTGRLLGAVEATIGMIALVTPERWSALLLAAFFLALTAFVVRLRRTDADAGCGCFGSSSAPPGTAHLILNVAATLVGVAAATIGVADVVDVFDDGVLVAATYLALLGIGGGLLLLGPPLASSLALARSGEGGAVPVFGTTTGGQPR